MGVENLEKNVIDLDALGQDDYVKLLLKDIHGKATEQEAESLRSGDVEAVREWHDTLVRILQAADAKLTRLRAETANKQQECRRKGPAGKTDYFDYEAAQEHERSKTVRFKYRVVESLKEAKALLHQLHQEDGLGNEKRENTRHKLDEILERLGRIETLLVALQPHQASRSKKT